MRVEGCVEKHPFDDSLERPPELAAQVIQALFGLDACHDSPNLDADEPSSGWDQDVRVRIHTDIRSSCARIPAKGGDAWWPR